MKKLFKWLGILLLALLILLLIILGLAYFLAGTDKGFSLTSSELNKRVPGLVLTGTEGNLIHGIKADDINFENDAIKVDAKGVDTAWSLSCLLDKEFCLDRVVIDSVDVQTFASDTPPQQSTGPVELPEITLPVGAKISEVLIKRLSIQLPGDAPPHVVQDIQLSAEAHNNVVDISTLSARYDTYTASVSGNIELTGDYPLDLDIALTAEDILPNELPEGDGDQSANVAIALNQSLKNLAVGVEAQGSVSATLTGSVKPLDPKIPVNLQLSSPSLGWPLISQSIVSASNTALTIDGSLDDYNITLLTRVQGEQIPLTTLQLSAIANTERASLPAVSIDTLDGSALGNANVSWSDGVSWDTNWTIEDINPEVYRPDLKGMLDGKIQASGSVVDGNWSLDLPKAAIDGQLQGYPFDLDIKLAKALDNVWNIERAVLNNGKNNINASGAVSDRWDLVATAQLPELEKLLPGLRGSINANVNMKGVLDKPDVDLVASTAGLAFNDIDINGLSLKADIKELLEKDSSVTLALGSVVVGENTIQNGRFNFQGQRSDHSFALFADGPQATAIDLNASGSLNQAMDWAGSLDAVTLDVPAHIINLDKPTSLSWNNALKKFAVDAHCWVTEGSRLCLENEVLAEPSGNAVVTLDQYALNRLDPFLPAQTNLTGQLSLDSDIKWGADQPGGFSTVLNAAIKQGGAKVVDANDNIVEFTYDNLDLTTQVNPNEVNADIGLSSKNLGNAKVVFTLDPTQEQKPIDGSVNLEGFDIGIAQAFLPDFDEVKGELNIDGILSGSLTDPRFDGEVIVDQPIIRAEILPLPITGGNITTTVKGRRAFIDGGLNSDDGKITIEGSANWRELDAWSAQVRLDGDALNIQSDPIQESQVNHSIKIDATPRSIKIGGTIDIPMAVIDVGELPQGAATVSNDIVIIEDIEEEKETKTAKTSDGGGLPLLVDIDISLGDDVGLSAYGLTANLTGDISVLQRSPNPPQLGGEIEVVDGIYKQYGQNLEATGQILFVGPVNQTRLAIDAVRTIDEAVERKAGIRIEGTVANPETSLFTEPADKQQDAILSYIVLGRDLNDTNDQEANLLASAALALTVRGGRSVAGGIASALGVQDFALETRGRGDDTELVVSGRLNDRLLLRYGRSVFQPESTLYLRYDLTKKLYLEAAQNAERAVDIFYTFSF